MGLLRNLIFIIFIFSFFTSYSQQNELNVEKDTLVESYNNIKPSFSSKVDSIDYRVYAFKYHQTWALAIITLDRLVIKIKGRKTDMVLSTDYFKHGLSVIAENEKYFKSKKKKNGKLKKIADDFKVSTYYKTKGLGKKIMMLHLSQEFPEEIKNGITKFFFSFFSVYY